jgi:hypothetical protein
MTDDAGTAKKSLIFWAVLIVVGLAVYFLSLRRQG